MRPSLPLGCLLLVLALPAGASAQNLPPVARARVEPPEVAPGESVSLVGSDSFDPDMGPGALTYEWELGDGTTRTTADTTTRYDTAGVYDVTLTVRDGATQSAAAATVHVIEPATATPPTQSSPLWLDTRRQRLWAVNPDSDTVSVVDTARLEVLAEIEVGSEPVALAPSDDGRGVIVVCRGDAAVQVVDADTHEPGGALRVGHLPWGIAPVPDGSGELLVAVEGEDRVVRLSSDGTELLAAVTVDDGPRAIAVTHDGRRAYVAHFLSRGDAGTVTVLDPATMAVERVVALAEDPGPDTATSGRGVPNLLGTVAVDPTGAMAWVGGLKANTGRGEHLAGQPLTFTNRLRAVLLPIDGADLSDRVDRRLDANDADAVSAVRWGHRGHYAYLAHAGAGRVSIYDMSRARLFERGGDADTVSFEARVDVGHAPRGLALSADGDTLYVLNELSRELSVVDVGVKTAPSVVATIGLTEEPLPALVALGKRMFHRSRDPVHSRDNYVACASCHPGGGMDGRTWDFTQAGEGLRNTLDLRGRGGTAFGPLHWSANFDEVQDFENDIVHQFGGEGLAGDGGEPHHPLDGPPNAGRSEALDALEAYVSSLVEGNPSPHRAPDGSLTEAGERGRVLFEDPELGCTECHAAPRYTDSTLTDDSDDFVLHDVGTLREGSGGRLGGPLEGLDTPSLVGLWDTAPYLHDGRAPTLREVLVDENPADRHGVTSGLSDDELDDLIAYLLQIDGRPDEPVPDADAGMPPGDGGAATDAGTVGSKGGDGGCACRIDGGRQGTPWVAVGVLWIVAWQRLRRGWVRRKR